MVKNLQKQIFEAVLSKYTSKAEAVEALSQLFALGQDAIYRRLRGDSMLTPEQIVVLTKEYNLSLDTLIYEEVDNVLFKFNTLLDLSRTFNPIKLSILIRNNHYISINYQKHLGYEEVIESSNGSPLFIYSNYRSAMY